MNRPENRAPLFELDHVVRELAAVRQSWREAQQRTTEPGGPHARHGTATLVGAASTLLFLA